eukprot:CAMPEP_0181188998 /NCGR_PEP_ID=MMETSP1096-20121128/11426_1 /TAXON_ID=156174 ORGANISM="Chrysochromulina ericina, Strain CCMP281" /NCGR_SAMPLE_ID=MMETSP1096 /ASSEMBLY_ACC=CAM_ASM_000453 /LENGTH=90 /DNA_ID=CAMNT_0023278119 /DNA_START=38 /DNA_END=310 /DNA_ORIENTATION=+
MAKVVIPGVGKGLSTCTDTTHKGVTPPTFDINSLVPRPWGGRTLSADECARNVAASPPAHGEVEVVEPRREQTKDSRVDSDGVCNFVEGT